MTIEPMTMAVHLFVYGSLRRHLDGSLHPLLEGDCEYVGMAHIPGQLYAVDGYPGAIFDAFEPGERVHGEVYRLHNPSSTLRRLDDYEECLPDHPQPHEYRRLLKSVTLTQGHDLTVWLYAYNHSLSGLRPIAGGDYRTHTQPSHDQHHSTRQRS